MCFEGMSLFFLRRFVKVLLDAVLILSCFKSLYIVSIVYRDECDIIGCFVRLERFSVFLVISWFKGILKLILVIFCITWKLAIGSINDIYGTLTRFLSMQLIKSDIIRWSFCHIFRFSRGLSNNWIFAPWTKIHFNPFKWYFNDIKDYMGVQSIFGLFLQLNWKETTFVTSWKNLC
jgi:hypothetical protein